MNEIEKNDQALIEEFEDMWFVQFGERDENFKTFTVLNPEGYLQWLRTPLTQKNKEREEAVRMEIIGNIYSNPELLPDKEETV